MRKLIAFLGIVLLCSVVHFPSLAQQVVPTIKADTNRIRIGEPVKLELQLSCPANTWVDWPVWLDSIAGFEVLRFSEPDTLPSDDKNILLRSQKVELTSFDSGFRYIPSVAFNYTSASGKKISVETDPVAIEVFTVQVDTTAEIKDIRPVVEVPPDYMFIAFICLGLLVLLTLTFFFIRWYKRRKPNVEIASVRPDVPPHIKAFQALDQLDAERLWQQGFAKQYHTRLTDVLRQYIEDRWSVYAMELTTDDLLGHSLMHSLKSDSLNDLERILRLADLVKFARYTSIPSENEWALTRARKFIEDTAPKNPIPASGLNESGSEHVD